MKSVINLIRTPLGFSLLDGDTELNKSANKNTKEKPYSIPKSYSYIIKSSPNKTLPSTPTFRTKNQIITNTSSSPPRRSGSTRMLYTRFKKKPYPNGLRSRRVSLPPW